MSSRLPLAELEKPLIGILWVAGCYLLYIAITFYVERGRFGTDAHAYWLTGQPGYTAYELLPTQPDAFLYSPAFAQLVRPLTLLPWPAFITVWIIGETAAFAWLLRPLGWRWALPLLLWCSPEIVIGNVLGFLGVALVLGFRRPWSWSAMALTKPVLALGAIWFLARREWRAFAWAVGATAMIAGLSFALDPDAWQQWITFLLESSTGGAGTLAVRSLVAVGVVVWAARSHRAWLLPVALLVATPVFAGSPSLTILAAIPRLLRPPSWQADFGVNADDVSQCVDEPFVGSRREG